MWVESDTYIGPCRRTGAKPAGGLRRLFDRRHVNVSDRDPSLQALLRQLRAGAQDLHDETNRGRFRMRLKATIDMARRQQANTVAQHLQDLWRLSDPALADARNSVAVERFLQAAMAAAPQR